MNLSIRFKIGGLIVLLIGITLILSFINWRRVSNIKHIQKKLSLWEKIDMDFNEDIHQPLLELKADLLEIHSNISGFNRKEVLDDIKLLQDNLNKMLLLSAENESMQKGITQLISELKVIRNKLASYDVNPEVNGNTLQKVFPLIREMEHQIDHLMDSIIDPTKDKLSCEITHELRVMKKAGIWTGGVEFFLGLGMLLFIHFILCSPLMRAADFARSLARGDFSHSLDIRQGDEVGHVCEAIEAVADILRRTMVDIKGVCREIRYGKLRARIREEGFEGEYKNLIRNVNELSDAFLGYLENLPMPVMSVDKDFKVLYLNRMGRDIAGEDSEGKMCYEVCRTSECRTERCGGLRALKSLKKEISQTDAHPAGKSLDVEYHVVPLLDREGRPVGFYELIIDQTHIKEMVKRMKRVAGEATEISERLSSASHELSAQVEEVSQGAEEQKMRIGEVATAIEEMNTTVLEVAKNASSASESASRARDEAEKGAEIVGRAIEAINRVKDSSDSLKENMRSLGERAESIGEVMQVISDIADQTNLLALNAAIEAARAGEAGRGFAVVADEVRKLAEKTMNATKEVGDAIYSIQIAARENIRGMEEASRVIEEATSLASESGEALRRIVDLSIDNANQIQSIATAAEEQSATSEEISRSVEEVNRIVSETTDSMVQSSQAVQELASMAGELRDLIEELEVSA